MRSMPNFISGMPDMSRLRQSESSSSLVTLGSLEKSTVPASKRASDRTVFPSRYGATAA